MTWNAYGPKSPAKAWDAAAPVNVEDDTGNGPLLEVRDARYEQDDAAQHLHTPTIVREWEQAWEGRA